MYYSVLYSWYCYNANYFINNVGGGGYMQDIYSQNNVGDVGICESLRDSQVTVHFVSIFSDCIYGFIALLINFTC